MAKKKEVKKEHKMKAKHGHNAEHEMMKGKMKKKGCKQMIQCTNSCDCPILVVRGDCEHQCPSRAAEFHQETDR